MANNSDYQVNSVCWNISNRCNMNCEFCFRELNEEELSIDENLDILYKLINNGVNKITFAGGEPLRYYGIKELIREAWYLGVTCNLVTNGYLLNENNMDEILPYLDTITFSLDSTDPKYNLEIGREDVDFSNNFIESSDHILDIIPKIRQKYDSSQLKIRINSLILKEVNKKYNNLDVLFADIYNDLIKYDIDTWKLLRFYALRGKAIVNKSTYDVPNDDFKRIQEYYSSQSSPLLPISIRDHKDMDNNFIVSPQGFLKKSHDGKEDTLVDLKLDGDILGGVRHV